MKKAIILFVIYAFILVLFGSSFAETTGSSEPENGIKILDPENPPELITERKLTDDEIAQMGDADLDTLKKRISTFGDFVAWFRIAVLDKLEFSYMESNERNQFVFGAEYAYSLLQYWFAPNMTVSIAQYVLEDDLPGIGRLFIIQKSDWVPYMRCANYIPVEDGYYIVNAELFSGADKDTLLQACNMDQPLFVKDLADLEPYLRETYPDNEPVQILAIDSSETVILDPEAFWYEPLDDTHVRTIYFDQSVMDLPEDSGYRYTTDPYKKDVILENGSRIVGMNNPPKLITERKLTDEEISKLSKADLATLKKKIVTYGDLIAWVRMKALAEMKFVCRTTTSDDWQYTFGAEFSFPWINNGFSPNMSVSVAQYTLEDDYPGIGTVCVILDTGDWLDMKCANYIPMDGGYYIVNAEWFAGIEAKELLSSPVVDNMLFVSGLSELEFYFNEKTGAGRVVQIFALDSADTIVFNRRADGYITKERDHVTVIYADEKAAQMWENNTFPKELENGAKILDPENPPGLIAERKLTDQEINRLKKADLDTLKKRIVTYGDLIAWVRMKALTEMKFVSRTITNDDWQYTFGAEFSFPWIDNGFSPNMSVSLAQYILEDDYPGIGTVCVILSGISRPDLKCANYIPADGGYYILNPELFIGSIDPKEYDDSTALEDILFVSDLSELEFYFEQKYNPERVVQILALDSADTVVLDCDIGCYIPKNTAHVNTIYYDEAAKYPPADAMLQFKNYGFPRQLNIRSDIDSETARKLQKGNYEDAAAAIHTLPDALNYLYYTRFTSFGRDQSIVKQDGKWQYNLKPGVTFRRGKGDCGAISALIAGLLEEDYEEVGMINLRFPDNGHVINYIKDGDLYYVFDGVNWAANNYSSYCLFFCYGKTLQEAAMKYGEMNGTTQMVAYTNPRGGDCPVIFAGNATKLPSHYCDLTILQETPEEGYIYILTDEDPAVMEAIDVIRGVW